MLSFENLRFDLMKCWRDLNIFSSQRKTPKTILEDVFPSEDNHKKLQVQETMVIHRQNLFQIMLKVPNTQSSPSSSSTFLNSLEEQRTFVIFA